MLDLRTQSVYFPRRKSRGLQTVTAVSARQVEGTVKTSTVDY